ncbi:response regulator [Leucobacter albus]|uniref:Response regulator n=1 Tax=Leucobacter albus TaxID=272210 RepID=A0ABW3TMH5_9MICO
MTTATQATIRVLIADDQALVRSGFRIILESEPDIEVVGEAANGAEAVALAASLAPDVICMDVEMPEMNGIEASRRILGPQMSHLPPDSTRAAAPVAAAHAPAVLILTTFGHDEYLFDALAAGVSGFLLKTSRAEQLIDAVRVIAGGGSLLGPEVTGAVLSRVRRAPGLGAAHANGTAPAPERTPAAATGADEAASLTESAALELAMDAAGLTPRERAVLLQLAGGHTNAEIAQALFLGEATVKTHVSNVLQKLGVRDRLQAVVWAHTRG